MWEAPPKKVGGTPVSAIHVQVHSEAGKPLRRVASAEQHPWPHPPPASPHGRTDGPQPPHMATQMAVSQHGRADGTLPARPRRQPPASPHGRADGPQPPRTAAQTAVSQAGPPPAQGSLLTWWSTLSVAMHWLLARVVISRLFGVSIRQLQRGTSWRPSVSPTSGPLANPAAQQTPECRRHATRPDAPLHSGHPDTGSLQTRSRQDTGSPGQDSTPHEESACLPCSVSELQPQNEHLVHLEGGLP